MTDLEINKIAEIVCEKLVPLHDEVKNAIFSHEDRFEKRYEKRILRIEIIMGIMFFMIIGLFILFL